jgi:hypothetical protein
MALRRGTFFPRSTVNLKAVFIACQLEGNRDLDAIFQAIDC